MSFFFDFWFYSAGITLCVYFHGDVGNGMADDVFDGEIVYVVTFSEGYELMFRDGELHHAGGHQRKPQTAEKAV